MRTRTLGLLLLAVSSALLLVRAPSSTGRTAEPDTRAEYMNPHDVTVLCCAKGGSEPWAEN